MTNSRNFAIETDGLTRRFRHCLAVNDLNLRVPAGAICGFIGLNGAGKSTTMRLLMGLLAPSAGRVRLAGTDVEFDPVRAKSRVAYVPDRPTAYGWMRVGDVLHFCERVVPTWSPSIASSLLKKYRLDPRQRVHRLSKGMGAKLSLLLAIAQEPDILLLDEPTDGLDPIARDEFFEEVLGASLDRPRTVLISSHSLADIQRATDYLIFIHQGRILYQGRTEELLANTRRVRLLPGAPVEPRTLRGLSPDIALVAPEGRSLVVTLRNFTPDAAESLRQAAGSPHADVSALSLDDAFKDIVKGMETACS